MNGFSEPRSVAQIPRFSFSRSAAGKIEGNTYTSNRLELAERLVVILNCFVGWFEVESFHLQAVGACERRLTVYRILL